VAARDCDLLYPENVNREEIAQSCLDQAGWAAKLGSPTPDGRSATATMTGVVNQAGTTIKGTWHLDPDNKTGNFEYAKR